MVVRRRFSFLLSLLFAAGCVYAPVDEEDGDTSPSGTGGAGTGGDGVAAGGTGGTGPGTGGTIGTGGIVGTGGAIATGGSDGSGGGPPVISMAKIRTVGYLPNYRGALSVWTTKADFQRLSYVHLAFADVDAGGNMSYSDPSLTTFVAAAHAANVKVCMAIGGAATIENPGVFPALVSPAGRDGFSQKIVDYLVANDLDCIDVDLEGNGVNGDYGGFVTNLRGKLNTAGKEMSAALAQWFGDKIPAEALAAFDFVNIMSYDLGGVCEFWKSTPCNAAGFEAMKAEVNYWVNTRGLPKAKAVVGVPLYGYRWTSGAASGQALMASQIHATYPDRVGSDWFTLPDGTQVTFDSIATTQAKAVYAKEFGGIMIWELGQDLNNGSMTYLQAIDAAL